jgi:hypothetical protein
VLTTEQFDAPLRCPTCGQKGLATWEESRLPTGGVRGPARLLTLSDGFTHGGEGILRDTPKIICDLCETTLPD